MKTLTISIVAAAWACCGQTNQPHIEAEQHYRFIQDSEPFFEQDKNGWPTNLIISQNYTNTIQVGTTFYKVETKTNVVATELNHYSIVICTIPPSEESFTNCIYSTNITTKLVEVTP